MAGRPAPRYLWRALNRRISPHVAVGLALIVLGLILKIGTHSQPVRRVRYTPLTQKIASGRVLVQPREAVEYRIEIKPDMRDAQVSGTFTAYGGETNAVSAVIMEQSEYAKWIGGDTANAVYSSKGEKYSDQFGVRLDPGVYTFAISNRLSKSSARFVYLNVDLIYYRPETE